MSITTIATSDTLTASRATINNNFTAVNTMHKGPSAPSSPAAGNLWIDDDTPSATVWTAKQYDGTDWIEIWRLDTTNNVIILPSGISFVAGLTLAGNLAMGSNKITGLASGTATTDALTKAQVDARIRSLTVPIGLQATTFDRFLNIGRNTMVVVNAYILVGTTVAASGTNYWTFQIRNVTAGNNLLATAKNTTATAITLDTPFALNPDQNLTIADGDVLQLQATVTLAPTALDAECCVVLTVKATTA